MVLCTLVHVPGHVCTHLYGSSIGMVGQYKTISSLDVRNAVLWHAQLRR